MNIRGRARACVYIWLASGLTLGGPAAWAANGPPSMTQADGEAGRAPTAIIVTGSRLPREERGSSAPLVVLDRARMEQRGHMNLADSLNDLPVAGLADASASGGQAIGNVGAHYLNLFGLGSQRTLTLVNGRRFVSANGATLLANGAPGLQVDLNTIPTVMIDRVELVAAGSAPAYGADAVAGTANILLKQDVTGAEWVADHGLSARGDARQWRLGGVIGTGFAGGRGHVTLGGEHAVSQGLVEADRRFLADAPSFQPNPLSLGPADGVADTVLIGDTRANFLTADGLPSLLIGNPLLGFPVSGGGAAVLRFDRTGALVPYDAGTRYGFLFSAGGDGLNLTNLTNLRARVERTALAGNGRFDLSDAAQFYWEGHFARTMGESAVSQAVSNSGFGSGANGALSFRVDNPFLDPAAAATIQANCNRMSLIFRLGGRADPFAGGCTFLLSRSGQALTDGASRVETELFQMVAGLRGDTVLAGRPVHYDISYQRGRTSSLSRTQGISQQRFLMALDARALDAAAIAALDPSRRLNVVRGGAVLMNQPASDLMAGDIGCVAALHPPVSDARLASDSAACVPLNYFGEGNLSDAARDYVRMDFTAAGHNRQDIFSAQVRGAPLSLPGGDALLALGYEYRREGASFLPDAASAGGWGRATPVAAVAGRYHMHDLLAEMRLPLLRAGPLLSRAEVEASVRHVLSSLSDKATSWSVGGRIGLFGDAVMLRAQYGRAIRAPALAELYTPAIGTNALVNDPCDAAFIDAGPNPANRRARCEAEAEAAGFAGLATYSAQVRRLPVVGTVGGNAALANERSRSFTAGVGIRTDWGGGRMVEFSADYMRIDMDDAISSLSLTAVMEACYDAPPSDVANPFCNAFSRHDGADPLAARRFQLRDGFVAGFANAGRRLFEGLNFQAVARFPLGRKGAVTLDGQLFHLLADRLSVTGYDISDDAGEVGRSRWRGQVNLGYQQGALSLFGQLRYLSPARFNNANSAEAQDIAGLGAYWLTHAGLALTVAQRMEWRLTVDNLFDVDPPFPAGASRGLYAYDYVGRAFRIGVRVRY